MISYVLKFCGFQQVQIMNSMEYYILPTYGLPMKGISLLNNSLQSKILTTSNPDANPNARVTTISSS